jgi:hypothetical protein
LDEIKAEFEGMTEMVTKIRQYDYNQLPNELRELDLEELETEFTGMKDTIEKINDKPVKDKFKDMDFTETKTSYENLKSMKNRLKMLPKDSTG